MLPEARFPPRELDLRRVADKFVEDLALIFSVLDRLQTCRRLALPKALEFPAGEKTTAPKH